MKNFPHQMNSIPKLVSALEVYQTLIQQGKNAKDDGVFGYAMARAKIYTFRNRPESDEIIEQRITAELSKPKSKQGPCTAARDIRRFFKLVKFVDQDILTNTGHQIIAAGKDISNTSVKRLWHKVMMELELPSRTIPSSVSHPYGIMLKLLSQYPEITHKKLALALEAEDDSDEELQRVLSIAHDDNWEEHTNASKAKLADAIKILPSIAKQIGDIDSNGHVAKIRNIVRPSTQRIEDEEQEDYEENNHLQQSVVNERLHSYSGRPKVKDAEIVRGSRRVYPRDRLVSLNALRLADNRCEIDPRHQTFIRKTDNLPYMEPHHLIPIAFSDNFEVSLDIEENVVSLCSNCHNAIHYGKEAPKLLCLLFDKRIDMLVQVGLEITINDLLKMYE